MQIGEVAAQAGVSEHTIRYYERQGLLPAPNRRPNGYRDYPPDTVALLRFIKRAQDVGFSLSEARALCDLRAFPGSNRLKVRALAEVKINDVDRRIADLMSIRHSLHDLVWSCCQNEDPRCPILEALDGSPATPAPIIPTKGHRP
jgi:DNA-binding transcriptional MerR regulator